MKRLLIPPRSRKGAILLRDCFCLLQTAPLGTGGLRHPLRLVCSRQRTTGGKTFWSGGAVETPEGPRHAGPASRRRVLDHWRAVRWRALHLHRTLYWLDSRLATGADVGGPVKRRQKKRLKIGKGGGEAASSLRDAPLLDTEEMSEGEFLLLDEEFKKKTKEKRVLVVFHLLFIWMLSLLLVLPFIVEFSNIINIEI